MTAVSLRFISGLIDQTFDFQLKFAANHALDIQAGTATTYLSDG